MKIAVIGAGLAGLSAADILSEHGHLPHIFEARDRVGGRTWSERLSTECVAERGAEFIYATDYAVRSLAARFELPIVSHGVRFARRTVNGAHVDAHRLSADFLEMESACSELENTGSSHLSLTDVALQAFGDGYEGHPTFLRVATSLAGDPSTVSARSLLGKGASERFIADEGRLLDGNQQLSESLATSLPLPIQFESPVDHIEQSDRGVKIRTSNGVNHEFDACVVAVPFPLLEEMQLEFTIPNDVTKALSNIRMGVAAKISALIDSEDFLDSALQQPNALWWTWQSLSRDGETRLPLITGFAGGAQALDDLQVANGPEAWLSAISTSTGVSFTKDGVILTDWLADEWSRGAYSYRSLDWTPADIKALQTPMGRVVLAGEHTGLHGTMNGAIVSGQRAAKSLIETLIA